MLSENHIKWKLGQVGMSWGKLGQVGNSWDKLGRVGNQRNYRNLTLKKRLEKEERKKKEEYRI